METKKVKRFKADIEDWINFNKNKPLHLIDLSQLMTIFKKYFILRLKK